MLANNWSLTQVWQTNTEKWQTKTQAVCPTIFESYSKLWVHSSYFSCQVVVTQWQLPPSQKLHTLCAIYMRFYTCGTRSKHTVKAILVALGILSNSFHSSSEFSCEMSILLISSSGMVLGTSKERECTKPYARIVSPQRYIWELCSLVSAPSFQLTCSVLGIEKEYLLQLFV